MAEPNRSESIKVSVSLINRLKSEKFEDQYDLLRRVCHETGLSMGDLLYNRGCEYHSLSRHTLWHLLSEKFNWGPSRIMKETGRDHSTVIYGLDKVRKYIEDSENNLH